MLFVVLIYRFGTNEGITRVIREVGATTELANMLQERKRRF